LVAPDEDPAGGPYPGGEREEGELGVEETELSTPLVALDDPAGGPYPGGEREDEGEPGDTGEVVLSTPLVVPEAVPEEGTEDGVAEAEGPMVGFDPTGQTVVYRAIVSVVTLPILAGQLVTVGAQDVMVYSVVV
jgi:hypothetical protein